MRSALDWFFRNRSTGEITIGQWPNAPLLVFAACAAITLALAPQGVLGRIVTVVGGVSLAIWALDEVFRGVNPWRRCLGGAVLAAQAYAAMREEAGQGLTDAFAASEFPAGRRYDLRGVISLAPVDYAKSPTTPPNGPRVPPGAVGLPGAGRRRGGAWGAARRSPCRPPPGPAIRPAPRPDRRA